MTLFTKAQTEQLIANCQAKILRMDNAHSDIEFKPVVKLFTPDAQCTWLLTELGLDDIAFGLCDLGMGAPELGYVSMSELRALRGPLGLPVERDLHFECRQNALRLRHRGARPRAHRHLAVTSAASPARRPIIALSENELRYQVTPVDNLLGAISRPACSPLHLTTNTYPATPSKR
jgi:Protein of unknown function (DUF2958)